MIVAVAYEVECEIEDYGASVDFSSYADVVGVADVTEYRGLHSSDIVKAMRKQYGDTVAVSIMGVDCLEV